MTGFHKTAATMLLASALAAGIVVEIPIGTAGATGDLRVVVQDDATGAGGSVRVPLGKK